MWNLFWFIQSYKKQAIRIGLWTHFLSGKKIKKFLFDLYSFSKSFFHRNHYDTVLIISHNQLGKFNISLKKKVKISTAGYLFYSLQSFQFFVLFTKSWYQEKFLQWNSIEILKNFGFDSNEFVSRFQEDSRVSLY